MATEGKNQTLICFRPHLHPQKSSTKQISNSEVMPNIVVRHVFRHFEPEFDVPIFTLKQRTEGKNQALVGAIPFCGEHPVIEIYTRG